MDRSVNQISIAVQHIIFGEHYDEQMRMRDVVVGLRDRPESRKTHAEDVRKGYDLLRNVVTELGGLSRKIAADYHKLCALFDWAAIAAPRLLPILSGHFNLTIGAIERLGNGSAYQQECLDELDAVRAVGVLLLSEIGSGTNVFRLSEPTRATLVLGLLTEDKLPSYYQGALDRNPDASTTASIADVLANFRMPGCAMDGYGTMAKQPVAVDIYTARVHHWSQPPGAEPLRAVSATDASW
ncbi:hypothetical protein ACQP1G_17155 [Nocardia sp. CA-107356]|uniref:hypothetical protein n=1 Tax=Nocardia sp. CA-107356 TaxID=3239972 RepID=UPI003D8D39D6